MLRDSGGTCVSSEGAIEFLAALWGSSYQPLSRARLPQPNDRRGNVENVTLAKLVNIAPIAMAVRGIEEQAGYRVIMINSALPFFSFRRAERK